MSLSDFLQAYSARGALRLHTPGHKGKLDPLDITELTDESFPKPQIAAAEKAIAEVYGAKHAHLLCGGSSQGVKAAVYFAAGDGIIDAHSHRSVFDGFKLSGKNAVEVSTDGIRPMTSGAIERAITRKTKFVLLTSPTYYGYAAEIERIASLCRANGLALIIDGAHGAHFGASRLLPEGFADKCDICNVSTHKTLDCLTQGAVLLDNLDEKDSQRLHAAVELMGTTSPSYLLYASIENSVMSRQSRADRYEALYGPIAELKKRYPFLDNDDFTRLVLDCGACGADAKTLNGRLAERGVYSELVTDKYIVFLFTASDGADDVKQLHAALDSCLSENK